MSESDKKVLLIACGILLGLAVINLITRTAWQDWFAR